MGDFSKDQGGVQSSSSTEYTPDTSGTPAEGIVNAPKAETCYGAPGAGIGNTRKGIH